MKVVCVDNFDREGFSDELVCENVNEFYGSKIAESLNNKYSSEDSQEYYKLVQDSYELYKFEP